MFLAPIYACGRTTVDVDLNHILLTSRGLSTMQLLSNFWSNLGK